MSQIQRIKIPNIFAHSLFFDLDYIEYSTDVINNKYLCSSSFLFDITFSLGTESYKPWEQKEETLLVLRRCWEKNNSILKQLFDRRNRTEAKPLMIQSSSFFLMSLFWSNQIPVPNLVNWYDYVADLSIKPVNCTERLMFIMNSPDHFQSYLQLQQLFDELNKKNIVSIMRQKKIPRV